MRINTIKIEQFLAERGLTKDTLSEKCGISRQSISTIVRRGTCEPKTVGRLARGLGVSTVICQTKGLDTYLKPWEGCTCRKEGDCMPRRKTMKLSTPEEIRRAISRTANMVLNKEIDPITAKALLYACNSALSAVRTDEYRKKVEELENLLTIMEEKRS